jgi:hypothetical protein
VSVRPSVSGFRPNFRFIGAHPRLAASLAAAAAAAAVLISAAPGASASTIVVSPYQAGTLTISGLTISSGPAKTGPAKTGPAKASDDRVIKAASEGGKTGGGQQQDFTFYDSITPSEIPAHQQIATYADGDYAVGRSSVPDPGQVIWIDVNARDPNADALDVEPGNATPSQVAGWVRSRLTAHPGATAIVYTMRSEWAAAKASVATLPASMRAQVRWWIADPTGHPHLVPGSQATQWYWGPDYDISTAEPGF